jgi:hypothetical protein
MKNWFWKKKNIGYHVDILTSSQTLGVKKRKCVIGMLIHNCLSFFFLTESMLDAWTWFSWTGFLFCLWTVLFYHDCDWNRWLIAATKIIKIRQEFAKQTAFEHKILENVYNLLFIIVIYYFDVRCLIYLDCVCGYGRERE